MTFFCRLVSSLAVFSTAAATGTAGSLSIGAPTFGSCGDVTINGVVFPSPGDVITSLSWDWGDAHTSVSSFPASHAYAQNGTYTVAVTAKSQAGEILTQTVTAAVRNAEDPLCAYVIRVVPGSLTFRDGLTSTSISVVLLDPSGVPIPVDNSQVTFTSANPALVSVDGQGVARASGFGQTTLTVQANGYPRTAIVPVTVGHLRIEPALLVLQLSGPKTGQLKVDAASADGTPLDISQETVTWSGSNGSGSVDGNGTVTALAAPTATVGTPQMRATVRGVGSHNGALIRVLQGPQLVTINRITASATASTVFYLATNVGGFSPTQLFSTYDAARIIDLGFDFERDASGISINNGDLQYLSGDVAAESSGTRPCGYNGNPAVFGSALDTEASCVEENVPATPAWGIFFHELGHNFTLASQRFSQFAIPTWSGTAGPTYVEGLATGMAMYAGRALRASATANNVSASTLATILNSHLVWWHPGQTPALDAYVTAGAHYSNINADIVDDILMTLMDKGGYQMYGRFLSVFLPANGLFPFDITTDAQQSTVFVAALSAAMKTDLRGSFVGTWGFPVDDTFYSAVLPVIQQAVGLSDYSRQIGGSRCDVNGDSKLNVADVQAVINMALGSALSTPAADYNGDGIINVVDIQVLITAVLGRITCPS